MEDAYWNRFYMSGKVEDYLQYRGMEICKHVMEKYAEETGESKYESDSHADRNRSVSDANGRVR